MKIGQKLMFVVAGGIVGMLSITAFSIFKIGAVAIGSPRHEQMMSHQDLLADALPPPLFLVETHLTFMELEKSLDGQVALAERKELVSELRRLKNLHMERCAHWDSALVRDSLKGIVERVCSESKALAGLVDDTLIPALEAHDVEAVRKAGSSIDRIYNRNLEAVRKMEPVIVEQVKRDIDESKAQGKTALVSTILGALLVGAAMGWFGSRLTTGIARSTSGIADGLDDFSQGNLGFRLDASDSSEELQRITASYETARRKLVGTFTHLQDETSHLGAMTSQLKGAAGILSDESKTSERKTRQVFQQAAHLDQIMSEITAKTSISSRELHETSQSILELSRTIGHIAQTADSTRGITHRAKDAANAARSKMDRLSMGAGEIEKILAVIQDIAEQTKLLALNATIEASRAGEAGKGFAVVASEVKQLAKQTAEATDTVGRTIEDLRSNTSAANDEILRIQAVVDEVDGVVATIAQAVEEQSSSTQNIASNMASATSELEGIANRIRDTAGSTQEITRTSKTLSDTGADVGERAREIADAAATLASATLRIHGDLSTWNLESRA